VTRTLVRKAAKAVERRVDRRGFLARAAVAASALAVAPVRFATRPVSAAEVIHCSNCSSGLCCDGWTTFCCTLTGANACPPDTYLGGWWKCTSYTGSGYCAGEGVRYYLDCNRTPGFACPAGCHCAGNQCAHRSTCCNVFRYGQCNTDVAGVTEVVCRVIQCVNPGYSYVNCNTSLMVENATCHHEEGCP
jgi:hypothetical protein